MSDDEVAGDHSDPLGSLVSEFLNRQSEADRMLETDPHAAMKDAVKVALALAVDGAKFVPCDYPGAALRRLLAVLDDLERGIVDPVLQPKLENKHGGNFLALETRLERVNPALAMELLIMAGRGWKNAAEEVVRALGNNLAVFEGHRGEQWRIVARWRTEIMSGADPDAKQKFDEFLEEATKFLRDREGEITSAGLVKIAHIALNELGRSG